MSADAVLLIDLENMIGSRAKQAMMERKLDALLGHAGAGTPAVAACAGSAITDVGTQLLASRHVKLHKVGGAKDAGDKKLREEAASRAGQGDLSSCPSGAISRADASAARSRLAWGGPAPVPQSSVPATPAADLAPLAAFGLGVIAGGTLLGAGTILGAAVALRLLRVSGLLPKRPSAGSARE